MQTSAPRRHQRSRAALVLAAGACALFVLAASRTASPAALFGAKPAAMTCREADGPLVGGINSAVHWATERIPAQPRVADLPVEAKLRVGLYTTQINNITIDAISIDEIALIECKRPRDILKWLPRALPDVINVSVTGIEVGIGLNYDSAGLCGLWCECQLFVRSYSHYTVLAPGVQPGPPQTRCQRHTTQ